MNKRQMRFSVSPLAAVVYPALLCTERCRLMLPVLLPAAVIHELGHLLALRLCNITVQRICVTPVGLSIKTAAIASPAEELLCALAGPVAGLLWADLTQRLPGDWAARTAWLSLSLSAFNLLPVPVLDGGHALLAITGSQTLVRIIGGCVTALLVILSLYHRAWILGAASLLLFLSCLRP